ncbi:MAG: gluconate 2-dehydrogenase subunit 3 family protein [Chitinispirillaceae bacterium]|nr:gluconate 2-dehydrogenase subunit 3 family protein [Chitinispirillaceae bacterium]
MTKRAFIGALLSFAGFWFVFPSGKVTGLFNRIRTRPLSGHEMKTLALAAEGVFPGDTEPGALALGIESYYAGQECSPYFRQRYLQPLRRLIKCLDALAKRSGADTFASTAPDKREELLGAVASDSAEPEWPGSTNDFNLLVDVTLEGCFSAPCHGGNSGGAAWRLNGDTFKREWLNA